MGKFNLNGDTVNKISLRKDVVEELKTGILILAMQDWMYAKSMLDKNNESNKAKKTIKEVEEFMLSEWFDALYCADGEEILKGLKLKYERGERIKRNQALGL